MSGAWIETFTGKKFDVLEPKQDQIVIEDIAHALSQLCRFNGHTKHFYSVAQHSFLGSFVVPPEYALDFLMHDASEAYIGDMSRPLKHATKAGEAYRPVEAKIMRAIRKKFNLPLIEPKVIHYVDTAMLYAEKEQLMGSVPWDVNLVDVVKAAGVVIHKMTSEQIEKKFLRRFKQLTKEK